MTRPISLAAAAPAALEWRDVTLDLGEFAVRDVSLRLDAGQWIALVGPTGAGKTLLLELAAGFLRPSFGHVFCAGRDITAATPETRGIAYAPQDNLLFPHLSVLGNLQFGWSRAEKEARADRLRDVVTQLGVAHLLGRRTHQISGGEAQRISLGRALLTDSPILLLDECTSALDEETRVVIGAFLQRQRREANLSVVQVTHDSAEAHRLADVVWRLEDGRLAGVVPAPATNGETGTNAVATGTTDPAPLDLTARLSSSHR